MVIARAVNGIFIVAGKRTPYGAFGGKLAKHSATDLQEVAARAALIEAKIKPELIDHVIIGTVFQSSSDSIYLARHVGLRVGVPAEKPALIVSRLCGSALQAVVSGCQEIGVGDSEIVLTGGTENMSMSPYTVRNVRFGTRLGQDLVLEDTLWTGLTDQHIKTPMGVTAENLAEKYNISRLESDEFAVRSHQRWKKAYDAGWFKEEMAPVHVKTKKGEVSMDMDEHPKPDTTVEGLAKLPPVFKKNGVVNAGNASGICDGAGCVILASESAVKKHNLTPLARIVSYGVAGCDPKFMGIGPVPAIEGMLKTVKRQLQDVDLIEINEAFAPQVLAVQKELKIDPEKLNVNGGAIAIGHPVGASGSRIAAHLIHELRRQQLKQAIASACIGGGMGISVLLERV